MSGGPLGSLAPVPGPGPLPGPRPTGCPRGRRQAASNKVCQQLCKKGLEKREKSSFRSRRSVTSLLYAKSPSFRDSAREVRRTVFGTHPLSEWAAGIPPCDFFKRVRAEDRMSTFFFLWAFEDFAAATTGLRGERRQPRGCLPDPRAGEWASAAVSSHTLC